MTNLDIQVNEILGIVDKNVVGTSKPEGTRSLISAQEAV